MPKYRFTAPNGRDYFVTANNPEDAQAGFAETVRKSPMLFQKPGVAAAMRDIESTQTKMAKMRGVSPAQASDEKNLQERYLDAASLGLFGAAKRGLGAGITAAERAIPGGKQPKYTAADYYEAQRLMDAANREKFAAQNPKMAFGTDVVGGLMMPGMGSVAKFVEGKIPQLMAAGAKVPLAEKALALGRASVVGGGMGAVTGAAQSRPGEAGQQAIAQGTMGAVLAPAVAVGLNAGVRGGKAVYDIGKRLVSPPTTSMAALEKLAKALQQAEVDPRMFDAAVADLKTDGQLSPTMYEALRRAGAGPDVLNFFTKKGSYPATRAAAESYATQVSGATQGEAIKATEALPGNIRSPAEIRADYDARVAQATRPPEGAPREQGAQALYSDLNAKRDTLTTVEKQGYDTYAAANPESAVIDDTERAPIITNIYRGMGMEPNPHIPAWKRITSLIDGIRTGGMPDITPELPELPAAVQKQLDNVTDPARRMQAEAQYRKAVGLDVPVISPDKIPKDAYPLTVKDLDQRRRALVAMQGENLPNEVLAAAGAAKRALDAELERMASEGKIQGDPEVVSKLQDAIFASADLRSKFGDGLAAKLTERVPGRPTETVVKPYQVGDVIFGKGEAPRNLNDILAEVEPIIPFADPSAVQGVKSELYTRIPEARLPEVEQRFSMAAPQLIPPQLSADAAMAASEAERLAAQRDEVNAALGLGEKVRTEPSSAFTTQIQNLPPEQLSLAQTGARQHLLDVLENPPPEATGLINQLQSARASANLPAVFGADAATTYQKQLAALQARAQGARELESAVGGQTPADETFVSHLSPRDLLSSRYAVADLALKKFRAGIQLSPDESLQLFNLMKSQNAPDLAALSNMLKVRQVSAPAALKAAVTKGFDAPKGDAEELDRMRTDYGLIY